ncbi:hypothetical protein J5Y09_12590 [Roseomonas sp. PWR1]|uniref:Calcium-binding protein n=1 Tax=Roseomonas nitratireducens TaxID=2820810 RepID=A0ABS4ATQ0_9PROT|nr:hypothetical protein [Neoroseomonas nitratireducens]MBP0464750.1 hypothetical protein [Neoroseomonas nitratireducens]
MTTYAFADVAGGSLAFVPAQDLLVFGPDRAAATLRFTASGADLVLASGTETLRLTGIGLGAPGLTGANLLFQDGSVLILDGTGISLRNGTAADDWIAADRGGSDTVVAAAGDDRITAGAALDVGDSLDGGAGEADTLALSGTVAITLAGGMVAGFERIETGAGDIALTILDPVVASATPGAGALFTVDATSQAAGSRLVVDARAVAAAGLALLGGGGDDSLAGGAVGDSLAGGAGDDTLVGGLAADTLEGGAGADLLEGGGGDDLFRFDRRDAPQSEPARPDRIADFAGAGRAGGDRIQLPGSVALGLGLAFHVPEGDFAFEGYGQSGVQLPASQVGDGFADVLWRRVEGLPWTFEIWADLDDNGLFGPADLLIRVTIAPLDGAAGFVAEDFAVGFGGLFGGAGNDVLAGLGGTDDAMWGEGGNDSLAGGDGVDRLLGGLGDDTLAGGDLADELLGGPGSDRLEGGDGLDTLYAADPFTPETEDPADRNTLAGGAGRDALFGGAGLDTLDGGTEDDLLWGDGGADSLAGGEGADQLFGREGDDVMAGGDEADTLAGGPGADTIAGGAGADRFVIDLSTAGLDEATGAAPDWVLDLDAAGGDVISLNLADGLVAAPGGPAPLVWRGAMAPRDASAGVPLGIALAGEGIGPGFVQSFFLPATLGGAPAGGWFIVDLDQDLVLGADDAVVWLRPPGGGALALDPASFAPGTFRVLVGGAGADSLLAAAGGQEAFGLGGADTLAGQGGIDRLLGGAGDDSLSGGGSADQLWGGAGADRMEGGEGADELFAEGPGIEEVDGFFGRNTLAGGGGNDSLWGADGRDSLAGGAGLDRLHGGVGADTLLGGEDADTLQGFDGADSVDGGAGPDSVDAGAGEDTVAYDAADLVIDGGDELDLLRLFAPATVTLDSVVDQVAGGGLATGFEGVDAGALTAAIAIAGGTGRNRLIGGGGADQLEGRAGNDTLEGGSGADTLSGDENDDLLLPGEGPDRAEGGAGRDTLSYADAARGVTVALGAGSAGGGAAGDTILGIEAVIGSNLADSLWGSTGADALSGGAGFDTLSGFGDADTLNGGTGFNNLRGGAGDDSLFGGANADTLEGGDGNDRMVANGGADFLFGLTGNDAYEIGLSNQVVFEPTGGGTDTVFATSSWYLRPNIEWFVLRAGAGDRFAVGTAGAERILGNEGRNLLIGGEGADTVQGGGGADRLQGNGGIDLLLGEGGNDTVFAGDGADSVAGGAGADDLNGDAGADTMTGGGEDTLRDILRGGAGEDWLDGGPGGDLLYGNLGNDTAIASDPGDLFVELAGQGVDALLARGSGTFTLADHVEHLVLEGAGAGIGNALSNRIAGGAGAETMFGRDGADTLEGAGGADILFGEAGRDAFLLAPGAGLDAIGDFAPGTDRLLLRGLGFADFAAVLAATRQTASGAVIDLAPGDSVLLAGVPPTALAATDIVFLP